MNLTRKSSLEAEKNDSKKGKWDPTRVMVTLYQSRVYLRQCGKIAGNS